MHSAAWTIAKLIASMHSAAWTIAKLIVYAKTLLTAAALHKTTICSWGNVIRMNGYLFMETGIQMSEYSDISVGTSTHRARLKGRPQVW